MISHTNLASIILHFDSVSVFVIDYILVGHDVGMTVGWFPLRQAALLELLTQFDPAVSLHLSLDVLVEAFAQE